MWGFLLGGALSLIGSLFSKPEPQPAPPPPPPPPPPQTVVVAEQKNEVDLKKLVKDSEDAGFNPLTVLRNGGVAGYQTTHIPFLTTNPDYVKWEADYNYEVKKTEIAWQNRNAEKQWMGSLISGVGSMVSDFGQKFNPTTMANAEYRRGLENDLIKSEIYRNYGTTPVKGFGQVNSATGRNASSTRISGNSTITDWQPGQVSVTNPWGKDKVDPNLADAEAYEARYGDIIQEFAGWRNWYADGVKSGVYYGPADVGNAVKSGWAWISKNLTPTVQPNNAPPVYYPGVK